nr:hypothetical protein Iba_chr11aCG16230 [Ipomoea batatas]
MKGQRISDGVEKPIRPAKICDRLGIAMSKFDISSYYDNDTIRLTTYQCLGRIGQVIEQANNDSMGGYHDDQQSYISATNKFEEIPSQSEHPGRDARVALGCEQSRANEAEQINSRAGSSAISKMPVDSRGSRGTGT